MQVNYNEQHQETRVLIVLKDLRVGNGMAACVMSYYDGLLKEGFSVDFLLCNHVDSEYMNIVRQMSGVYYFPKTKRKWCAERRAFAKIFLLENRYDIIHVNLPGPIGAGMLELADTCKIRHRVYHCHNPRNTTSCKAIISGWIYQPCCIKHANSFLACSKSAGKSNLKQRRFTVLKNCINTKHFQFEMEKRNAARAQLGISDDTIVIGSVGRLEDQKNPLFALQCFHEYHKMNPNSYYIWVGNGSMEKAMRNYIQNQRLESCVLLAGVQSDMQLWYSTMDVFLLPSKFEGLGIVFIEAQAAGLEVFGSEQVPDDTEVTAQMHRLSLNKSEAFWAEMISNCRQRDDRERAAEAVAISGYDIETEKDKLAEYYHLLMSNTNK